MVVTKLWCRRALGERQQRAHKGVIERLPSIPLYFSMAYKAVLECSAKMRWGGMPGLLAARFQGEEKIQERRRRQSACGNSPSRWRLLIIIVKQYGDRNDENLDSLQRRTCSIAPGIKGASSHQMGRSQWPSHRDENVHYFEGLKFINTFLIKSKRL